MRGGVFPGRIFWRRGAVTAAAFALCLFSAVGARAGEPEFLALGVGAFDVNGDKGAAMLSVEYTDARHWIWELHPMTGAFVTTDGSLYGYAGLALDMYFGSRVVLTPSLAPGLYMKNGGKDLGRVIEFRAGLKLAWRFDDRSRLGIDFSHLSNASMDEHNPGANQLLLYYSIPLRRR